MKVSDFLHTLHRDKKTFPDIFRVRTFANKNSLYAVVSDLNDMRTGHSITQYIELAYQDLVLKGLIQPECILIEHYDGELRSNGLFNLVNFSDDFTPSWKIKSLKEICQLVGCDESEFLIESLDHPRIYNEVIKFRHQLSPFFDQPYQEHHKVIARREAINKNKISKTELIAFIGTNPTEREIHKLLESDLSIFGDYFSSPPESYIVFSELPLKYQKQQGIVDFVVFTSSSRMEVILIEIKGANYNLINKDSYNSFSQKTRVC